MKETLNALYWDARGNLDRMQVSKMTLRERVKYEKALTMLDAMKYILDRSIITPKP